MLTKAQIKRRVKRIIAFWYRIGLKNKEFSIISNNCWGGVIYDKYALQYLSPTIGLWIPPTDFCKFCKNLKFYFDKELMQIHYSESHVADLLRKRKEEGRYQFNLNDLIVGRIEDIDIIFIHYKTFEEAKEKWDKRKKRINYENLLIKCNDQNGFSEQNYVEFCQLDYRFKLFFTARKEWSKLPFGVFIKKYEREGYVVNDTTHGDVPINTTKYLNGMLIR